MEIPKQFSFSKLLKNLLIIVIIIQFIPGVISFVREEFDSTVNTKPQIGLLSIDGMISDSTFLTKRIEEFEKNSHIKAVLVKINSQGGTSGASEAVFKEILRLKKAKPVVAWIENVGASGGYWIACGAHKIVSVGTAMVGSIGVMSMIPNVKGLLESCQIKIVNPTAGKFKSIGFPANDLTTEHLAFLQGLLNDTYTQFTTSVAQQRNISIEMVDQWADGKIFTGSQALALNLVDAIGSFSDAVEIAKEHANIKGDVKLVVLKKRQSKLMQLLMGKEEFGVEACSWVSRCVSQAVVDILMTMQGQTLL